VLSYPNLFTEVQVYLPMSLSVLDFSFQRNINTGSMYVYLYSLFDSHACPSSLTWTVLPILNEPHESQSSSCVIPSIPYILYPSWKQNNVIYFWIINKISHYFLSYSISDTVIWDVMHSDNGERHWSERKSYIYAGGIVNLFYVKLKLSYWTQWNVLWWSAVSWYSWKPTFFRYSKSVGF